MQGGLEGILPVDKPAGMTSHDVVARLRRVAGTRAVGHTGTLDPMATGLMLVCIGGATRVARFLLGLDKVYEGTFRLGGISTTYDAEGEITAQDRPVPRNEATLRQAMARQVGHITQMPPPYSAVKVKGRKLYEYARAGEEIPERPREVHVRRFELVDFTPPNVRFEAHVGSGAYIRSLAHDVGASLECGGYLTSLRRTRVGGFAVDHAVPLAALMQEPALLAEHLMGVTEALAHMPKLILHPGAQAAHLHGRPFTTADILECDGILFPGRPVLVTDAGGRAISIVESHVGEEAGEDGRGGDAALGATPMLFKALRVLGTP